MNAPRSPLQQRAAPCSWSHVALTWSLLCAIAHGQDDPAAVDQVVAAEATLQLNAADPVTRGEAALIIAARSNPANHTAILDIARDSEPEARLRGIVALGLQATPGVAVVLEEVLEDSAQRSGPAGIAAAFALGLLPPDSAPSVTNRVLASFLHGSMRRQRDVVLALLLGLSRHEPCRVTAALRRLYDDDSVRDPIVRAWLLHMLLPADATFGINQIEKLLDRGDGEERSVVLDWLGRGPTAHDGALQETLCRIATQSSSADERAQALAVLTRMRYPPALEIAARALRSSHAVESGQGIRSVLAIGGASMRAALDQRVREEDDSNRKAAMLANFDAPPSRELVDQCVRLAADVAKPLPLRIAATRLLARDEPERAQPLLRDLFRACSSPALLDSLANDLARSGDLAPLHRLLDDAGDPSQQVSHWRALLAADHTGVARQLLASMSANDRDPSRRRAAFTLWRQSHVLSLPRLRIGTAPEALLRLLDG